MRRSTLLRVLGLAAILNGFYGVFLILSGAAWNCPQPYLLNVSRIVSSIGQVLLGLAFLVGFERKRSLVFSVPAGIVLIAGTVLTIQAHPVSCSALMLPVGDSPLFGASCLTAMQQRYVVCALPHVYRRLAVRAG